MTYTLIPSVVNVKAFKSFTDARKFMEEKGARLLVKEDPASTGTKATTSSALLHKGIIVIAFHVTDKTTSLQLQKSIVHESLHVIRIIQKELGMKAPLDEEVDAYMLGQTYEYIAAALISQGATLLKE